MKIQSSQFDDEVEVDMSPMIDMVFLLLIFFIVASVIVEDKIQVDIPAAAYAKIPPEKEGRVEISVNKDEELFIFRKPVTLEEFEADMAREIENNPDVMIVIRTGKEVKYSMSQKIMEALGRAGASDLIYSAFEE
jgi:biopolymer transport protein ExbD